MTNAEILVQGITEVFSGIKNHSSRKASLEKYRILVYDYKWKWSKFPHLFRDNMALFDVLLKSAMAGEELKINVEVSHTDNISPSSKGMIELDPFEKSKEFTLEIDNTLCNLRLVRTGTVGYIKYGIMRNHSFQIVEVISKQKIMTQKDAMQHVYQSLNWIKNKDEYVKFTEEYAKLEENFRQKMSTLRKNFIKQEIELFGSHIFSDTAGNSYDTYKTIMKYFGDYISEHYEHFARNELEKDVITTMVKQLCDEIRNIR